jgi:hypothetical protein
MGRSSEEFIRLKEVEINSLPTTEIPEESEILSSKEFWRQYFMILGNQFKNILNEEKNI